LFVALRKSGASSTDALNNLFDWAVSTNQEHLIELRGLRSQQAQLESQLKYAKTSLTEANNEKIDSKLSDEVKKSQESWLAERKKNAQDNIDRLEKSIESIKPNISEAEKKAQEASKAAKVIATEDKGTFKVLSRELAIAPDSDSNPQLAFNEHTVYFSTNEALLARAVSVGDKHYPNLAESAKVISPTAEQFLFVEPKKLAVLIQHSAEEALPQEGRTELRAAYDYHMPARLQALAKQPAFSVLLDKPATGSAEQWQALTFHTAP
jgi:hypothetical protein